MHRQFPRPIKRIVVKVGSSVVATYKMSPKKARLKSLTEQICKVFDQDREVILVSSGAVVLGMGELNERTRPKELAGLQACAAIGQAALMDMYREFFKMRKRQCGQILLTWDDFDNRNRYINARNTMEALLARGVIPVINENDTIATEEMKFGDNDRLASMVAGLVKADLLLILSDVDGLYDMKDGRKKIFREIKEVTAEIEGAVLGKGVSDEKKHISRGGMSGKLEAIKVATKASVPAIIANGEMENVLLRVLDGERVGTLFMESEDKILARKHWISFGVKPKGVIKIDDGARTVLLKGGKSLLLPGIVEWEGHFKKDDVVAICDRQGQEIGRGIINYSVGDLHKIVDRKGQPEAIHYDNMVLSQR